MPTSEEFKLRPLGWENDPEEELFKLSALDYLTMSTYNNYALFFKLDDVEKRQGQDPFQGMSQSADGFPTDSKAVNVLKEGLERTLSQTRQLVGRIEKDGDGYYSIVRRKNDTVKFVVQHLDAPEDTFPSFAAIEQAHFVSAVLGDIQVLSNAPMTYGEKPEADADNNPVISSFKANLIPGGLIFNMHSHHYSNDIMGWASFTRQLAENCYAIVHKTPFPSFDPKCLDNSRFATTPVPEAERVDAPPRKGRHPQHKAQQSLLFHLSKSKAAELKRAAWPDGSTDAWISTYDAVTAIMWRVFSQIRAPVFWQADDQSAPPPVWGEGVNLTKRLTNPPPPSRMQWNCFFTAVSFASAVPQPTRAEIVSEAPLSRLASYTRQMTSSITEESVKAMLQMVAPVRNKKDLCLRVSSFPPTSLGFTDWRDADVCTADFGFGKPMAYRHLFDVLTEGMVFIYPPRWGPAGADEGIELLVVFEKELVPQLLEDPDWTKYFEFRGIDTEGP